MNPLDDGFAQERERMVLKQLISRDVVDKTVLAAFSKIPRHLFVSRDYQSSAYNDCPLPIGFDQTISQPYMVAFMTQLLRLKGGERVLEIGTGSGYQAAILAELGADVFTVELVPELSERARALIESLGYRKVYFRIGDGNMGWSDHAPFDAITVTCAPETVPQSLIEQLKVGGRLVVPIGPQHQAQTLTVFTKTEKGLSQKHEGGCFFVPMRGATEDP